MSCTDLFVTHTRLQAHISKVFIEDFALVSDAAYVAQNAGRIIRALLEIALSRNWANCALLLIDLSKAIERRMWPYEHPLGQLSSLQRETLYNLRRWADDTDINDLREMDPKDIGELVHMNVRHGTALHDAAMTFPTVGVSYALRPVAHDLLQITVSVQPQFKWSVKLSGNAEPFYVWVQDEEGLHILQWRSILLRQTTTTTEIEFVIPWTPETHNSLSIVTASDRWLGSDSQTAVSLVNLVMPPRFEDTTQMLDLPFLPINALDDADLIARYRAHIPMLNSIQSQAFWSIYHTNNNVLVSAPVACGKSVLGELAIWHAFRHVTDGLALVVVPSPRAASETAARIRGISPKARKVAVTIARSFDALETASNAEGAKVVVATPNALSAVTNKALYELGQKLSLIVLEDLHELDALYELSITKLLSVARAARTRVVGLTCTLIDPFDLASWLGVDPAYRLAFAPRDRGAPVVVQLKTFSVPHSATLLKTMVKPTYDIIKSSTGSVVVFVPSRSACRSSAADLVTQSGTEMDLNGFLQAQRADVEPLVTRLHDNALLEPLLHGIGYILPNMAPSDLALVLELFASGIVKALIAPRDACWTLPVHASTVVLMGAQYIKFDNDTQERTVINYSRLELVKMQGFAVSSAQPAAQGGRMFVMCQAEQQVGIARTLGDGLPLESKLPAVLQRKDGTATAQSFLEGMLKPRAAPPPPQAHRPRVPDLRKRDLADLISWTLLSRRVRTNPTFYDLEPEVQGEGLSRLIDDFYEKREAEERAAAKALRDKEKKREEKKDKADIAEEEAKAKAKERHDAEEKEDPEEEELTERAVSTSAGGDMFVIEELEVLDESDSD